MPKGAAVPTRRQLTAVIGPVISGEFLAKKTEDEPHRDLRHHRYNAPRELNALRDGEDYPWDPSRRSRAASSDTLTDLFSSLPARYAPEQLAKPTTWYFSLGDGSNGKWTLSAIRIS